MSNKRPFLKQKLSLYFDENITDPVVNYFQSAPAWKKKVRVTSARALRMDGRPDRFQYDFCKNNNYTLITLDLDFDDDKRYPFTFGKMTGIIMIKASSADVARIVDILGRALIFVTGLPLPRAFLTETKFVAGRDGVMMRGRDASTKEIKTLHVVAGATLKREIREFFSF
jgi:predicted nuclease of predicted toxin-antitoxin system